MVVFMHGRVVTTNDYVCIFFSDMPVFADCCFFFSLAGPLTLFLFVQVARDVLAKRGLRSVRFQDPYLNPFPPNSLFFSLIDRGCTHVAIAEFFAELFTVSHGPIFFQVAAYLYVIPYVEICIFSPSRRQSEKPVLRRKPNGGVFFLTIFFFFSQDG